MLNIADIRSSLVTKRIGRNMEHVESTSSTNDDVWERVEAALASGQPGRTIDPVAAVDGLVILAEHQSAGRGRHGNAWESPRGASVLGSVAIVDERRVLRGGELGMIAAIAVRDAVVACTEIIPTIKWPNDLLVSGKKLGGVLVESRICSNGMQAYVVGIGINCLQQKGHIPAALADIATSLELESRHGIDRDAIVKALLHELDRWLATPESWTYEELRRDWLARCEPMGERVLLKNGEKTLSGTVLDIDPTAALVVQLDEGGIRAFNAADTRIVQGGPAAAE